MDDKTYEALKTLLQKYSDYWRACLGLHWWRITYVWDRDGSATQKQHPRGDDGSVTAAFVVAKWQYLEASITYDLPELHSLETDVERERTVLHEHCHLLVQELRPDRMEPSDDYLQHEERVVTTMTCAFWWTRLRGRKDEKIRRKAKKVSQTEEVDRVALVAQAELIKVAKQQP